MNKLLPLLLISLLTSCSPQMQTANSELSASEEEAQTKFIQDQEELEREAQASADFAPPPDSPDEIHLLPNAASKEYSASDWIDDYPTQAQASHNTNHLTTNEPIQNNSDAVATESIHQRQMQDTEIHQTPPTENVQQIDSKSVAASSTP